METRSRVSLNRKKLDPMISVPFEKDAKVHASGSQAFYKADKSSRNDVQLTTNQLSRMFNVTLMTIYNWRLNRGMPYYHLPGGKKPPVRYDEGLILNWAESHGIPIEHDDYLKI